VKHGIGGLLVLRWIRAILAACVAAQAWAIDDFERPPIEYSKATPENRVSELARRIETGEVRLAFDDTRGYLDALLPALGVPIESQTLVFSKTSLQRQRISPKRPRAVYFNDDVYVGFCQAGDVLEISVADPKLGTVFYTLDQKAAERPAFLRQTDNCLLCHGSSRTGGVPGHIVRSVFADASGEPILSAGSTMVDHTTPFEKRWGGWYVTGTHGDQKHVGNLVVKLNADPHAIDNASGQNVTDLESFVQTDGYLSPHSDIVALMVLEHQTLVHNRITQANFATRQALDYELMLNKALGEPEGKRLDSTTRRIASAGDDLVEALLMVDEAPLTEPVAGTSGYAERFSRQGPRDSQGRSLRDFDLKTRMFRYPCSYLVYSESFDALPGEMKDYVWQRLWKILSGEDPSEKFAHLSPDDRQAIKEILRDTKPGLPAAWH
jgi:hypothetical protein